MRIQRTLGVIICLLVISSVVPIGTAGPAVEHALADDPSGNSPIGTQDTYTIFADTTLTVEAPGLRENDVDPDGDSFIVSNFAPPDNGTLTSIVTSGAFTYVPDPGFTGTDSFTYVLRDEHGTFSDPVNVTINVLDSPNRAPIGIEDAYVVANDRVLSIDAPGLRENDLDPDNDSFVVSNFAPPDNGTLTSIVTSGAFTYVPDSGFVGTDSFTYVLRDDEGNFSDPVTVSIEVTESANRRSTGTEDAYVTVEGTALSVEAPGLRENDLDPDNDSFVVSNFAPPDNGTLTSIVTSGAFTYVPDSGFVGTDSFTYVLRDDHGAFSDSVNVTIDVVTPGLTPVGAPDAYTIYADTTLEVEAPGLIANDIDPDDDSFVVSNFAPPDNGTLTSIVTSGAFTYVPDAGFVGTDSFTYVLRDDEGNFSDPVNVTIHVRESPNRAPIGATDVYLVTSEQTLTVEAAGLIANDIDPDDDSFVVSNFAPPDNGTLTSIVTSGAFTYIPDSGFTGTDSFTYILRDEHGTFSDRVNVTIEVVDSFNRQPIGTSDAYTTLADTTLTVEAPGLSANDIDPDDDSFVVSNFAPPENGTLTSIVTSGAFTYVPDAGFVGTDSFTYTLRDEQGAFSDAVTVTIDVVVPNTPPEVDATVSPIDEGDNVTLNVSFTDPDADDSHTAVIDWGDGTSTSLSPVVSPFSTSHAYGDDGTYIVTIVVRDEAGGEDSTTRQLLVRNVAPSIEFAEGSDFVIAEVGTTKSIDATATDPGSDDLTVNWSTGSSTTYFNDGVGPDPSPSPNGTFPFTVTDNTTVSVTAVGVGSIEVIATDDDGGSANDTITTIAVGDEASTRGKGYWANQYAGRGPGSDDEPTLEAFLLITGVMSGVFSEEVPAATIEEAEEVLGPSTGSKDGITGDEAAGMRKKATAELLAAWLNFAAGGVGWDERVDTGVDSVGNAPFHEVIAEAERILLDPDASHAELERAKDLSEAINQHDE